MAIFIQKMSNGEQPVVYGDGEQTRDFVYVGDVAKANVMAIENSIGENVLNIGTGVETSINQLVDILKKIINPSIEKKYASARQGEQKRSVIDSTLARRSLKWQPEVSMTDGLIKTFEYFKSI